MSPMWRAALAAALGVALLAGCAPITVSATLFGESAKLHEATVEQEPGAAGKVILIDVRGLIADRTPSPLFGPATNPIDELASRLRKAAEDPSVRAVVLRINSPGGTVTASDIMYREVRRFAETTKKPVVVSMGEIAASGGYYLSLAADRIVAEPTTITGSIGVIIPTLNVSDGLGKLGIRSRSIVSGKNKDVANPLEPERDQHFALLQGIVDEFYTAFRAKVEERRGAGRSAAAGGAPLKAVEPSRLDELADGRILTGRAAEQAGLIDQLGGIREAFAVAKDLAGIKKAQLVKYHREDADVPRTLYTPTANVGSGPTEVNLVQIRTDIAGRLGADTPGVYYLWLPPG